MSALNDTFDMTTAQRFAYGYRLPPELLWLLIGLALYSLSSAGAAAADNSAGESLG